MSTPSYKIPVGTWTEDALDFLTREFAATTDTISDLLGTAVKDLSDSLLLFSPWLQGVLLATVGWRIARRSWSLPKSLLIPLAVLLVIWGGAYLPPLWSESIGDPVTSGGGWWPTSWVMMILITAMLFHIYDARRKVLLAFPLLVGLYLGGPSMVDWIHGSWGAWYTTHVLNVEGSWFGANMPFLGGLIGPWMTEPVLPICIVFALLGWWISEKANIGLFTLLGLLFVWNLGLWVEMIQTLSLILVATAISISMGIPLGILAALSTIFNRIIMPILDFMQTLPAFVYLIPAIAFFGLGETPAVFATVIFSTPPVIRLTALGIRQVPAELVEAADAFGSTRLQKLVKLQLPLAGPAIRAGINQTILLALSMVVIAAMIGARGLGSVVWRAIQRLNTGMGFEGGLAIVILAIILDRILQHAGSGKTSASKSK